MLVPDRIYRGPWGRSTTTPPLTLARVIHLPHVNVTTMPFHVGGRDDEAPAGETGPEAAKTASRIR